MGLFKVRNFSRIDHGRPVKCQHIRFLQKFGNYIRTLSLHVLAMLIETTIEFSNKISANEIQLKILGSNSTGIELEWKWHRPEWCKWDWEPTDASRWSWSGHETLATEYDGGKSQPTLRGHTHTPQSGDRRRERQRERERERVKIQFEESQMSRSSVGAHFQIWFAALRHCLGADLNKMKWNSWNEKKKKTKRRKWIFF